MELRDYLAILWGRKWVIIITAVATLMVVTIGTFLAVPLYEATITLRVATAVGGTVNYTDYQYADRLMNTYTEIVTSGPILDDLAKDFGRTKAPKVSAEIVPNTELMLITVEDSDPELAAAEANALARILIDRSRELYTGSGKNLQEILSEQLSQIEAELSQARQEYETLISQSPGDSERIEAASRSIELKQETYASLLEQYEQARVREAIRENTVSVVEPAVAPEVPSKPRKLLNIVLGLLVGLVGGVALAFSFEYIDKTLYTEEQIETATTLPTLGSIPTLKNWREYPINGTPFGEAFRRLRTQILASNPDKSLHTLLITSAEVGEGKSMIAANLAFSLAKSGQRVILMDCDLRRPSLHKLFKLPNNFGLSNALKRYVKVEEVVQNSKVPELKVLTSGPLMTNSTELLGSSRMSSILKELEEWFDIVILDTPSLLAVTDAALLIPQVDGVLLVISRGQAREKAVKTAEKQLSDIHARLIGVVINRVEQDGYYAYYQDIPAEEG
jgi:capsular exopolysaccharide synthesis family protein